MADSRIQYSTIDDFIEALDTATDWATMYTTRNGWSGGQSRFQILGEDIPESIQDHISEPNVTSQLLDLHHTGLNIVEKGSASVTQCAKAEQLTCAVSGQTTVYIVTAWERRVMHTGKVAGQKVPETISGVDLRDEGFKDAKVHILKLAKGDCVYIPNFWWY